MGTPQHPGFKKKHIFWPKKKPLREWGHRSTLALRKNTLLAEKKAPAGMGTPQHPGFKKKHIFWSKKKPLREWGHRSTLVLE